MFWEKKFWAENKYFLLPRLIGNMTTFRINEIFIPPNNTWAESLGGSEQRLFWRYIANTPICKMQKDVWVIPGLSMSNFEKYPR